MRTVKRGSSEKVYTYREYVQKFRPKSLHEETEDAGDNAPFIDPPPPALDHPFHEGRQASSSSEKHK